MDEITPRPEPSPPYQVVTTKVGDSEFTAGFYPGFASAISVNDVSVYQQKDPFVLPEGTDKPWTCSAVNLSSTRGYRVLLQIDDPNHVVDYVQVFLRNPQANGGGVTAHASGVDGDLVRINNTPVLCPPNCG